MEKKANFGEKLFSVLSRAWSTEQAKVPFIIQSKNFELDTVLDSLKSNLLRGNTQEVDFIVPQLDGDRPFSDSLSFLRRHFELSSARRSVLLLDARPDTQNAISTSAWNKLLKVLEDQNQSQTLVLIFVDQVGRLIETIRSRCIEITAGNFAPISNDSLSTEQSVPPVPTEFSEFDGWAQTHFSSEKSLLEYLAARNITAIDTVIHGSQRSSSAQKSLYSRLDKLLKLLKWSESSHQWHNPKKERMLFYWAQLKSVR